MHLLMLRSLFKMFAATFRSLAADVCVIGGGHAGCEAAAASARTGAIYLHQLKINVT